MWVSEWLSGLEKLYLRAFRAASGPACAPPRHAQGRECWPRPCVLRSCWSSMPTHTHTHMTHMYIHHIHTYIHHSHSVTHSVTHPRPTPSLAYSLTHTFTYSHSLTHTHSHTHTFTYLLTHSLPHSLTHLLTHLIILGTPKIYSRNRLPSGRIYSRVTHSPTAPLLSIPAAFIVLLDS